MQKTAIKTADLAYMALMAAFISICAWISVPTTVPFTMQTFAICVAGGLLGAKRGALTVFAYVLLGAIGLPVFSGMTGGIGQLFGTTGGYLIGFIILGGVTGFFAERFDNTAGSFAGMIIGNILCYVFGTAWYMVLYTAKTGAVGLMTVLGWCVFPFIIPDILKMLLALVVLRAVKPRVHI